VTLREAASERLLWADALTCKKEETAGFVDSVAGRVTAKLQSVIRELEIDRAWRKEPEELTAWELTIRAQSRAMVLEPTSLVEGLDLASKAVELAPLDPLPLALMAWCQSHWATFSPRYAEERAAARTRAEHAAQLHARDPNADALFSLEPIH
jgi:hypothetical protein